MRYSACIALVSAIILSGCNTTGNTNNSQRAADGIGAAFMSGVTSAGIAKMTDMDDDEAVIFVAASTIAAYTIVKATEYQQETARQKAAEAYRSLPEEKKEYVEKNGVPLIVQVPTADGQNPDSVQLMEVDPRTKEPINNNIIEVPADKVERYTPGEMIKFEDRNVMFL